MTPGGRHALRHVKRIIAELDEIKRAGRRNGSGQLGEVRLGVRTPPIGDPLSDLLASWHRKDPKVELTLHEMHEHQICAALEAREIDGAFMTKHTLRPHAVYEPIYSERMFAALPSNHRLASCRKIDLTSLRPETILVQGWNDSQSARELYASFLGSGADFRAHPASKQSILALVAAGFGITLATAGQAQVKFPGVIFKSITDANALLELVLTWLPSREDSVVGCFIAFMRAEAHSLAVESEEVVHPN
ncbi:LysR family substrate-binding domain-containing protein [Chelatococcus sp. SYSU_G07232]|uniref:LysR family substrate-binding domain-containing protein n=1 Tax=Chelatococcus albus TaxID=3047466 RepID=A0ABT7AKR1_9HYPH|nr:LysR family substrate-binding domain-containing protein [Chelatococcus sp. SYSU_G07232]MDJ1159959.1 LysR family substrate-binding domain-containing protein [Chelatococcus sp. SYSU_G07232]